MYDSKNVFLSALYNEQSKSIPDFLKLYEQLLLEKADDCSIAHSRRIQIYRREITNKAYLYELRKIFNGIYKLIDKTYPELRFSIVGRRKSAVSTDGKIIKNINQKKSLDLIRDTNAFRILLFGESSPKLIQICYDVMNSIIRFNCHKGFTLCDADPIQINQNVKKEHPEILIPDKTGIADCFLYGIKDYILNPKENGYQSLHCTFRRPNGGECFEVQVRTFDMHVYAEAGKASHLDYKQRKYHSDSNYFDRKKIHIPGYGISPQGEIFDFIGFENSLEILKRQKTF